MSERIGEGHADRVSRGWIPPPSGLKAPDSQPPEPPYFGHSADIASLGDDPIEQPKATTRTIQGKVSHLMSMGFLADRLLIDGQWGLLDWSDEEVEQCRTALEKLSKRTLALVEQLRGPRF